MPSAFIEKISKLVMNVRLLVNQMREPSAEYAGSRFTPTLVNQLGAHAHSNLGVRRDVS